MNDKFLRGLVALGSSLMLLVAVAPYGNANMFTFTTPAGSTAGGEPVIAEADFVTGVGSLTVTLKDLLANPTDAGQLLSDTEFTLTVSTGASSLTSSSAQEITVNGDGSFTLGPTVSTGWGYGFSGSSAILCVICSGAFTFSPQPSAQPSQLIIGPPGGGGTYSAANGSIAGNSPHNPFLNTVATFTISDSLITPTTSVSGVVFSFGTTPGVNVPSVPATPEPASLLLLGSAFAGLGIWRWKKDRV